VLEWPKDGTIYMEGMKGGLVKKAYLLADTEKKPLGLEPHERS
jgi:hypothetical protein